MAFRSAIHRLWRQQLQESLMPPGNGKVIIITGASAGIGAATAVACAARWRGQARLILGARRMSRLEEVAARCRELGAAAIPLRADVSRRDEVEHLVAAARENFRRVDVMIANAGYGFLTKIHETSEEQFDEIMATNVKGTWYAMQAAAQAMLAQEPIGRRRNRRGHIIAVSSGAARRGLPLYGVYSMTKSAQLSLTEAMRVELAPQGVYVSSVHPLTTATEFFEVASQKSRTRSVGLSHAQSAAAVGHKIVRLIEHPRPELWPVPLSHLLLAFAAAFPRLVDRAMARAIRSRTR
jgi:short-subunit dehydrogenase